MAFTICDKHGGHIAPHLCHDAAERISKGETVPGVLKLVDFGDGFSGGFVCGECLNKLNAKGLQEFLKENEGLLDQEEHHARNPNS